MSLNPNHQRLEGSSYHIQPSSPYATSFDGRLMSQVESTSDSAHIHRARRTVPSPRDRCRSFLLIFTLYLLFSICLAIGLSYTDNNQVHFMRWLSFPNIAFSHGVPATPSTWEGLKGGEHCLRYATREYTARLSTNAIGQEAMRACKETPTEIHGRILQTDFCQNLGLGRGVWGFWIVDFDEPVCLTQWDKFVDLGCEDSNLDAERSFRRIEAHLENLQIGADWRIMCTTTPADIHGRHFSTPAECFNLGKLGVFGAWDVQDTSC